MQEININGNINFRCKDKFYFCNYQTFSQLFLMTIDSAMSFSSKNDEKQKNS